MIQIKSNKKRAVFTLRDRRTVTENTRIIRYEFLNDTHEEVTFFRYADSAAFLFARVDEIELEGQLLTPETAEDRLSVFFEKTDTTCSGGIIDSWRYFPLAGNSLTTPITGDMFFISDQPTLSLNDTAGPFGSIYGIQSRERLMVLESSYDILLKGDGSKVSYQRYPTNPVVTTPGEEVAILDDIITVTDGDGTKFLTDDGTYKSLSGFPNNGTYVKNGVNDYYVDILPSPIPDYCYIRIDGNAVNIGTDLQYDGNILMGKAEAGSIDLSSPRVYLSRLSPVTVTDDNKVVFLMANRDNRGQVGYLTPQSLKEYLQIPDNNDYLPLTGGTLSGNLEFESEKTLVFHTPASTTPVRNITFEVDHESKAWINTYNAGIVIGSSGNLALSTSGSGGKVTYNGQEVAVVDSVLSVASALETVVKVMETLAEGNKWIEKKLATVKTALTAIRKKA